MCMFQWILIFSIIRGLNTTEWSLMRLFTLSLPSPKKISKYGRVCSLLSLSHISLGLLDIFSLDCLIAKPTRKTKTAETLLDLILTNDKKKVLTSGVVDTQFSDHSLVYTITLQLHADLSVYFRNGHNRWILYPEGSIYSSGLSLRECSFWLGLKKVRYYGGRLRREFKGIEQWLN